MTIWQTHGLTEKVQEVLGAVPVANPGHHFGGPFITAYQLAIGLERLHPDTVAAIGKPLGGAGTGQQDSLAQYLALELSRQIRAAGTDHPVEGAFLSNEAVRSVTFSRADGT